MQNQVLFWLNLNIKIAVLGLTVYATQVGFTERNPLATIMPLWVFLLLTFTVFVAAISLLVFLNLWVSGLVLLELLILNSYDFLNDVLVILHLTGGLPFAWLFS